MDFTFTNYSFETFEQLKPYFDELLARDLQTLEDTKQWIKDYDMLSATIQENVNRRYVKQSCDTTDESAKKKYLDFVTLIGPKLQEMDDVMNKKIVQLPFIQELKQSDEAYKIWLASIEKALEMFREENIPLTTTISEKANTYGDISGAMNIEIDWQTLTLQQATKLVDTPNRDTRKSVYDKIWGRRLEDKDTLDNLLTELITMRNQVAINAGYDSFVEYQWDNYNRFDYTQQDVFNFHAWVKEYIVPIVTMFNEETKKKLWLETLTPYDLWAPTQDERLLRPFTTWDELLEKTIACMHDVYPQFAENLRTMKSMWRFDLDSRSGKSPGGYNSSMPISGYSFIFMNAAWLHRDVETLVHEAWHAMHSVYSSNVSLYCFNNYPMEIAEVASMSMELVTMDWWKHFYSNAEDLKKAQIEQVEWSLATLCRVATIDSFQYWLYKNPTHTIAERDAKFASLINEYQPWIDYSWMENIQAKRWQPQLHIFEVPFYYIEYGIAQLGAYGVWKNYKEHGQKAIEQYIAALRLWYTKSLPDIYKTAWIEFNFSPEKIWSLGEFVLREWKKLQ
jgi:oligoendopeptidase F